MILSNTCGANHVGETADCSIVDVEKLIPGSPHTVELLAVPSQTKKTAGQLDNEEAAGDKSCQTDISFPKRAPCPTATAAA